METIIKIEGLRKKYGRVMALNDVNMEIKKNRCYGLLGPNGSGKSTLFKILAGIVIKTSGHIEIFGRRRIDVKVKERLHYLPDENNLYLWMSTDEVVWFFSNIYYKTWRGDIMKELMTFLEIPERRKVISMSRGQRARLKLAVAFSTGVDLLFLDDPLIGIDVKSREMIINAISNFWNPEEQTLFISSHIIKEIEGLLDYVYFIDKGEIVLEGEADNLRERYGKSLEEIAKEEI